MSHRSRSLLFAVILAAFAGVGVIVAASRGGGPGAGSGGVNPIIWVIASFIGVATILFLVVRSGRRPPGSREKSPGRQESASDLGLDYIEKAEKGFHHDLGPLPGVPRGGDVTHLMQGVMDGRPLTIFQHSYVINTGQATIPVQHTVYTTPAPDWPITIVRPRRGLLRLLYALGYRRGLLLEDESFNAVRRVESGDEDFALTLLHPQMQQFMTDNPRITWCVHPGGVAMIYGGSLKFDRVERSIERFRAFWDLVPPELERW